MVPKADKPFSIQKKRLTMPSEPIKDSASSF
jgi:hypothetical protein